MEVAELKNILQDGSSAIVEIQPGKRYLLFVDPTRVDIEALTAVHVFDSDIQAIPMLRAKDKTMAETAAMYELKEFT